MGGVGITAPIRAGKGRAGREPAVGQAEKACVNC